MACDFSTMNKEKVKINRDEDEAFHFEQGHLEGVWNCLVQMTNISRHHIKNVHFEIITF